MVSVMALGTLRGRRGGRGRELARRGCAARNQLCKPISFVTEPRRLDAYFEGEKCDFTIKVTAWSMGSESEIDQAVASLFFISTAHKLSRLPPRVITSEIPRARHRLMSIARIASVPAFALRVGSTSTRTSPHPARARVPIRTAHVASDSSSTATMPADAPPSLRLCYFDVMAKGLQVWMVANHSGLKWQGKPEGFSWRDGPNAMKPSAPFGQMPLLFVGGEDKPPVAQATAIASVIGKLANTDGGSDMNDFAMSNMLLAQGEDMYNALQKGQPTLYAKIGSGIKTDATHAELWEVTLPHHLDCLEKLCDANAGNFTSTGNTIGEMFLWGVIHQVVLLDEAFTFENR
jgi:glutathione S-transferase